MIQIYYGDGKGKTTAAVGASIRAAGSGMRVLFLQFLKDGTSSECSVLAQTPGIDFCAPSVRYQLLEQPDALRAEELRKDYDRLLFYAAEHRDKYQLIVLDEVLDAFSMRLVDKNLFDKLLHQQKAEVILTGHSVTPEMIATADYVTEMKMIKHPYNTGTKCRKGIEY